MSKLQNESHYDVIVIGGGPGGSSAATFLADYGKSVLLLERDKFPRYHIGESLLSGTLEIFRKLGVLEKLENTFVKKWGVEWVWGETRKKWTTYFKDAVSIPFDYGFQVERAEFDKILLDNAAEHGVRVQEQCKVVEGIFEGGRVVGVCYEDTQTLTQHKVYARWVIDASGQGGALTAKLRQRTWDPVLKNMAIWSYWRGAKRGPGIDQGNTFLPTFADGWWWFIPQRNEITSIGAVIDRANYDRMREMGPEAFYQSAIERTPEMAERLVDAKRIDDIHILRDWSYEYDQFYGEGYVAVGDAACFIDPLFSTGVHLALLAGYMSSLAINTILDKPETSADSVLRFYEKQYKRDYRRYRDQVYFLYAGQAASKEDFFWKARNVFDNPDLDPRRSFISLIAGSFEHRGWYHRCLKRMGTPKPLERIVNDHSDSEQFNMNPEYFAGRLARPQAWQLVEDFAIDGNHLISAQSILTPDGNDFPLTPLVQEIAANLENTASAADLVNRIAASGRFSKGEVHGAISDSLAHGVLTLA